MVVGGHRSGPRRSEGMEEFANILQRDYGLKPQGKAAPMTAAGGSGENGSARNGDGPDGLLFSNARPPARSSSSSRSMNGAGDDHLGPVKAAAAAAGYDDVFGGPPSAKYSSSKHRLATASGNADDAVFRVPSRTQSARVRSSNSLAFHRPLYDDDEGFVGVGVPGARSSPGTFDDVFGGGAGIGAGARSSSSSPVEELLGGIGITRSRGGGEGFLGGGASLNAAESARANKELLSSTCWLAGWCLRDT